MLVLPLLLAPIAFAGGLWAVSLVAPPLAPTRTGRAAARVVDVLGGAAAAVLALKVYVVVRTVAEGTGTDWEAADYAAYAVAEALWQPALLLAAAAAVHLLAPPQDDDVRTG